jgi:hypothetical protein
VATAAALATAAVVAVSSVASTAPPAFTITGSVHGLYPGLSRRLVLTVHNKQRFAIVVTSIATAISDARAGCTRANLTVTAFSGRVRVGAGRTGSVGVTTTLRRAAPNACKGATFPLHYTGTAHKAAT